MIINTDRKLNSFKKNKFFDLKNHLTDDLLVKANNSSIYTSLESRAPFLYQNIVE